MDVRLDPKDPPRTYQVGWGEPVTISDCGTVHLEPDEQLTFVTPDGGEYDLTRKSWGFYATPSLNARLSGFGLRAVLVRNRIDRYFVLLLENGHEEAFHQYLDGEGLDVVLWLDDTAALAALGTAGADDA